MMKPINPVTGQAETNGVPRHELGASSSIAEPVDLDSAGRDRTPEVACAVAVSRKPHRPLWEGSPYAGEKWVALKTGTRWARETRHVTDRTLGGGVVFARGRLRAHGSREVVETYERDGETHMEWY